MGWDGLKFLKNGTGWDENFEKVGWDGMKFWKNGMGWDENFEKMGWDGMRFLEMRWDRKRILKKWDGMRFFRNEMGREKNYIFFGIIPGWTRDNFYRKVLGPSHWTPLVPGQKTNANFQNRHSTCIYQNKNFINYKTLYECSSLNSDMFMMIPKTIP